MNGSAAAGAEASGGDIWAKMNGQGAALFRWHPAARLFGPDGVEVFAGGAGAAVIADRPGFAALRQALAGGGAAFRIGDAGPAPDGAGLFETQTSGTTGVPRRIVRSQASWLRSFAVNAGLFGIGPGVRVAVPGRLSQSLALYGALEGLHLGAEVHLLDGLRPDRQGAALAARGIDVVWATPAQLRLMLEAAPPLRSGPRLLLVGGARLDPATRAIVGGALPGAVLRAFYGAAETSFVTLADAATPEGSVGRAYPGVELLVEGGAIRVRSPYLFARYAGADAGGASWQDGWLSVGEFGRLEGGWLYLSGRAGRMVTIAGQNVFPEEVEAFLLALPGVTQACVLPRADRLRGHVLVAAVQGLADPEALLRACRRGLGPLKAPRWVQVVADWPLLSSGKTDLAALDRAVPWPA